MERSESSAANSPEGRESGHNPTASKDSPQVSGEAREEACLVTNSNTSYNKQPKKQFRVTFKHAFKHNSWNSLITSICYEIITDQIFYKHYTMYTKKVPKYSYQKWDNTLYSFKQEMNVSTNDSMHSVTGYRSISMNIPKSLQKLLQTTRLRVQTGYCLVHLSKGIIFISLLLRHLRNRGSQTLASWS